MQKIHPKLDDGVDLFLVETIFDINPNANNWIEIGSHIGESTTIFLGFTKIKRIHTIDINPDTKPIIERRLHDFIKIDRLKYHFGKSEDIHGLFKDNSHDVVYIDGCHEYECVKQDIKLFYPKIKSKGFLCGHDYNDLWPGVKSAVHEFVSENELNNNDIITFTDSSWMIQKN